MASSAMAGGASVPFREARGVNSRVLDESARERRQKKVLEALEMDNLHDEPHADLVMSKKAPKFQETLDSKARPGPSKKRKLRGADYYKRFAKSFQQLLEEDWTRPNERGPTYSIIEAPPPKRPPRKLCNVCGFPCAYTCIKCGVPFCTVKCMKTHRETRCLKWIA